MRTKKLLYGLIFILLTGTSCNTYKKYTYLRDLPITGPDQEIEKKKSDYIIQPGDILYVRVATADEDMGEVFNPFRESPQTYTWIRNESMYYLGYTVNDEGYIEMPVIDKVQVAGSTLDKAKEDIERVAQKYLKKPQVILKMAQFRFTLLGEVESPGIQNVYDNDINLIEAVSYGGGITYNGDRREVVVLRSTKTGTKTFKVDMTDKELIKSELYQVMPNDIIYVKPRRNIAFRQETSNFLFGLGALSSTLTAALLVVRLGL